VTCCLCFCAGFASLKLSPTAGQQGTCSSCCMVLIKHTLDETVCWLLVAAAVCRAINDCQSTCRVPGAVDSTTRVALDMCTSNGRAGGTLVPEPSAGGATCKVDADCPTAGHWCNLADASQVCVLWGRKQWAVCDSCTGCCGCCLLLW
jgi:hypothetical protein